MRKKEFMLANITLLALAALFGLLTIKHSINQDLYSLAKNMLGSASNATTLAQEALPAQCSKKKPLAISPAVQEPHIRELAKYQNLCKSYATDTLMFFTHFSETNIAAEAQSKVVADRLFAFHSAGVKPIVVAEPYGETEALQYKDFLAGKYDEATDHFFGQLKRAGITDAMMGTWVPFPESNTPNWENKDTEPRDFALCVNRYLSIMKKHFPKAQGSVLLNAMTFEPNDLEWENGDYLSLVPYLSDIDKKLVSSVGIQGFPWASNATTLRREIFRASEFLQPDLAIAAAQEIRTRDIWLNTGTFAAKYADDDAKRVHISLNERRAILNGIIDQARELQNYQQNGYRISINLFSEDKTHATEATDWSYFQNPDSEQLLKEFLTKATSVHIPVSLFDKSDQGG